MSQKRVGAREREKRGRDKNWIIGKGRRVEIFVGCGKIVRIRGCCEYSPWIQNLIITNKVFPCGNKSLFKYRCSTYGADLFNKCSHILQYSNTFYFQPPPTYFYPCYNSCLFMFLQKKTGGIFWVETN
jgi:hypothetical protein